MTVHPPKRQPQKPGPKNFPRITSALFYDDANAAIDWLCEAFGFELRLKVPGEDGGVLHSELIYGDGVVMVADCRTQERSHPGSLASPRSIGNKNTQSLCVYIDDADVHCAVARAAGAQIVEEPKDHDYGEDYWAERGYLAMDPEGHRWWFMQRLRG